MTKSTKIIIGVLVLIIFLSVLFFVKNNNDDTGEISTENESSEIEVRPTAVTGKGSLDELLKRNENLECLIIYKDNPASSEMIEGTYYTSNGKMRGDFISMHNGQEILSSMIIKDNTFYSWSVIDGQKFGMKASVDQLEASSSNSAKPRADNGPVALDQAVDYDCKPWNKVDGSVFELPSDVIFRDFGAVINTGMEYGNIYETDGVEVETMIKEWEAENR